MPGQHKNRNRDEYSPLFSRIEEAFDPEEMTADRLKEYLNARTPGMEGLAEQLAQASEIAIAINQTNTLKDLRDLEEQAKRLEIHSSTILERIIEKEIALSFSMGERFAEEKGIKLTERTISNVENWNGREVLTIRKNGKFVSWKRL